MQTLKLLFRSKKSTLTTLVVILILLLIGYGVGTGRGIYLEQNYRLLSQQKTDFQRQLYQLEYRNNILAVELDVERAANRSLQQELRLAQDSMVQTRRELAFYQRVVSPELDAEGMTIDSVLVRQLPGTDSFYFRVILLHTVRTQELVRGRLEVFVRGHVDGERRELNLAQLAAAEAGEERDHLSFAMNYFSLQEGTWTFPVEFAPESLRVRVTANSGQQTERIYTWSELLSLGEEISDES
ncbi:MAG: hypothetical protein M1363_02160 [Gammaproteobacteria bacterium]|nr:hypothetical protein [Gammaproteobacteria bacterium]